MNKIDFQKGIQATGNFIGENKKPLLYVGGAIAVIVLGVVVVSKAGSGVKNFFSGKYAGSTPFVKQTVDVKKTTITDEQAKTYANQLYNAMEGGGTDEDTIKAIIKAINAEDYKLIYNEFGRRSYYIFGAPTITAYIFRYTDLDLNEWFKKEIDSWTDPITYKLIKDKSIAAGLAF